MSSNTDIDDENLNLKPNKKEEREEELSATEFFDGSFRDTGSDGGSSQKITYVSSSLESPGIEVSKEDLLEEGKQPPVEDDLTSKDEDDDHDKQDAEGKTSCREHPRVKEMYQTADWWSLWIGLMTFAVAMVTVFAVPLDQLDSVREVIPQPQTWQRNPFDAWNAYNLIGIPILLLIFLSFYLACLFCMGNFEPQTDGEVTKTRMSLVWETVKSFGTMSLLAVLALWLGSNEWASEHGFGYAVFAIVLGMLVGNILDQEQLPWLFHGAKDGEFFIKCSLTLLAVELDILVSIGALAMVVAWIGSPLAIVLGYWLGKRLFNCKDSLSLLIAVGASWCGASAISAVAPIISASSEDVTLSIGVVAFFTVIFTFAQPYFAMAVNMPDDVAGAWIGGSVDQTGNVIVSAAIISEEATEVAGIVKMVLNAGLGVMASVVACYWYSRPSDDDSEKKQFHWIMLWDKFPKFTLGFIITSVILTGTMQGVRGTLEEEALPRAISTMNKWWFAIAFVGIGITTNIKKLFEKAWSSGIIQVYLLANTIDVLLALGLSYLAYGLISQ